MSEYTTVTPELMAGFLDEAPEYLEMLDEGLMAFESKGGSEPISLDDPEDHDRMNTMFRAAHSLKGLAAAMGFDKIRELTHLMETLFDQIRMGKRAFDPASIETLFGVFDTLRELVRELADEPDEPVTIDAALETLRDILDASAGARETAKVVPAQPDAPADVVPGPNAAADAADTRLAQSAIHENAKQNVVLDDPELAKLFVETTLETIEELNQGLLKLEQDSGNLGLINEIFRCAHNIKGATGAAGCDDLHRLTHNLETILDRLRCGQMKLDEGLTNALLGVTDVLRSDIELIRDGRMAELACGQAAELLGPWLDAPAAPEAGEAATTDAPSPEAGQAATKPPDPVQAGDNDDDVVVARVTFPTDFAESEIQAYLIHNKLSGIGKLLRTDPDMESLDGTTTLDAVTYELQTSREPADLESLLRTFSIKDVTVTRRGAPAESAAAPEPLPADAAPPTPAPDAIQTSIELPGAGEPPPADKPVSQAVKSAAQGRSPDKPAAPATQQAAPAKKATGPKIGETLRVDLERLDQLMNLGGELVINKARLVQIHGQLKPVFSGPNIGYLVDDISERLTRLSDGISGLSTDSKSERVISEMAETTSTLLHDFEMVRGLFQRVHESRAGINDFSEALHGLNRISEGIQKRIMETRMVSVGPLFQRFRRVVRDIAKATGKDVELVLHGESTELDKRMIDELGDPLTHMVRNSVDHGIEPPDERVALGKPRTAQVVLNAYHRGRHICIEVRDDGRGVNTDAVRKKILERELASPAQVEQMSDKELIQYVFKPGFSTAEAVTDLSGRGMGMDIVINKLEKINGTVEIDSEPGKGTVVTIKLPLTLAIITSLVARIGKGVYAIPLELVAEIIQMPRKSVQHIQQRSVVRVRDRVLPVVLFEQVFKAADPDLQTQSRDQDEITLLILGFQDDKIGLVVDEMIGQQDVVIKNLATNFRNVPGIAGASIMGDGSVSLILDVAAMMTMMIERSQRAGSTDGGDFTSIGLMGGPADDAETGSPDHCPSSRQKAPAPDGDREPVEPGDPAATDRTPVTVGSA